MARFGSTLVIVIVLIVSLQEASALQCWSCNSATTFCGSKFDEKKLPKSFLIECPRGPRGGDPVCLKVIHFNFISRYCVNNEASVEKYCYEGGNRASVCEECSSDGCNGAAKYGPAAAIVAIPIVILKTFLLF